MSSSDIQSEMQYKEFKSENEIRHKKYDKFFFFYSTNKLSNDCCCGFSIKTGIKLICAIYLLISISNLFTVIKEDTSIEQITSMLLSILYLTSCLFLFISLFNLNYLYAKICYFLSILIFVIDIIDFLWVTFNIGFGKYNLFDVIHFYTMYVIFNIMAVCMLLIEFYFIWVIFCFYNYLKNEDINSVYGENFSSIISG